MDSKNPSHALVWIIAAQGWFDDLGAIHGLPTEDWGRPSNAHPNREA